MAMPSARSSVLERPLLMRPRPMGLLYQTLSELTSSTYGTPSSDCWGVLDLVDRGKTAALCKRVDEVQGCFDASDTRMAALVARPWGGQAAPLGAASSVISTSDSAPTPSARASGDGAPPRRAGHGQSGRSRGGRRRTLETDPCRICNQLGHWADWYDVGAPSGATSESAASGSVGIAASARRPSETDSNREMTGRASESPTAKVKTAVMIHPTCVVVATTITAQGVSVAAYRWTPTKPNPAIPHDTAAE